MNLLVTGGWYESRHHIEDIREMGHEVVFLEKEDGELPCEPAWVEGIVHCKVFNFHPIEEFVNLRFIQTESAGYDRVPMEYCKEHGIPVHNVGTVYAGPISEYIICHLLEWYHNLAQEHENKAAHGWVKNRVKQELTGKKVCIIGTGNIAKFTARKLAAFDCEIVGISHTVRDIEFFSEICSYESLHDVLAWADVVIVATPPCGVPVMGASELGVMKPDAVLVNVSRGAQVDEAALVEALGNGDIAAAILDVFEVEPLPADSPLWELDNVIITPHSSYIGVGNAERLWQEIKHNLSKEL